MGKLIQVSKFPKRKTTLKKPVKNAVKKPDLVEKYINNLTKYGERLNPTKKRKNETETHEFHEAKRCKKINDFVEQIDGNYELNTLDDSNCVVKDLFHSDALRNSDEYMFHTDWFFHIRDEISLEGLDGITLQALWVRLKHLFKHPFLLEGKEETLWNLLKLCKEFQYFILPTPREKLVIFNRFEHFCPNSGIVYEPVVNPETIYGYSIINSKGIRGSCAFFNERIEQTETVINLSYQQVLNEYGDKLVIVASQRLRENAIFNEIADPRLELMDNEYGLLERIGRARNLGELTQGNYSLLTIFKDSSTIFHVRKTLEQKKLLKKQFFTIRNQSCNLNKTGKLLHLPRFYRVHKSNTLLLVEEVVELLRQKPGYSIEFGEFKKYFPRKTGIYRTIKTQEFRKYVKTNVFRPYRFFYPNASKKEWKCKVKDKEKELRFLQLIDPTVNVAARWVTLNETEQQNSDDECLDDETPGTKMITPEFLKEVFLSIFETKKDGITIQELVKKIELDYYTLRTALKKLQAKNVIDTIRRERGKQRHILYFARCFHAKTPFPNPVSKPLKLPENILQKILQPQQLAKRSSCQIENAPLKFNASKILKICENVPFVCNAFLERTIRKTQSIDEITKPQRFSCKKTFKLDLESAPGTRTKFYKFDEHKTGKTRQITLPLAPPEEQMILTYSCKDLNVSQMLFDEKRAISTNENEVLDFESLEQERQSIQYKISSKLGKDYVLGASLIRIYSETIGNDINVSLYVSTPPAKGYNETTSLNYISYDKKITRFSLFRLNSILELVRKGNGVIDDLVQLQKDIQELQEQQKEYENQGKIDRITMNRLILKLSNEGYVKVVKLEVTKLDVKNVSKMFLMLPSVENFHPSVEAAKHRILVKISLDFGKISSDKMVDLKSAPKHTIPNTFEFKNMFKPKAFFGHQLGYAPKFVRMRKFHELLYYLIYDYEYDQKITREDFTKISKHFKKSDGTIPTIYRAEIGWRMFIPPMNDVWEMGKGWGLLCQIILSTPLSIWVKVAQVSLECHELIKFLEHPVKRHFLISDIPKELQYVLMFRRRYITYFIESCQKLAFIGLAQMGPSNQRARENTFVYLNKNASLLETTTAPPEHEKVSPELEYPRVRFEFNSRNDVEEYWCKMYMICMNTYSGQMSRNRENRIVEVPAFKLAETIKPKNPAQAIRDDNGQIPGDKSGAAGLDSSLWSHLKRNWSWVAQKKQDHSTESTRTQNGNERDSRISKIKSVQIRALKREKKVYLHPKQQVKQPRVVRKPAPRGVSKKKKQQKRIHYCDSKDKAIRTRINRAVWTWEEDVFLNICKAASTFLTGNPKVFFVPVNVIRDVLHVFIPQSRDKTTNSCKGRRSKQDPVLRRMIEYSKNLMNIPISKHFTPIICKKRLKELTQAERNVVFFNLINYCAKNSKTIVKMLQGNCQNADYFARNNVETFAPILVEKHRKNHAFFQPTNAEQLKKETIKCVIFSLLNNTKNSTTYQLFKIFTRYPDHLIRSALVHLKNARGIIINKRGTKRNTPFKLSHVYRNAKKSKLSLEIIRETFQGETRGIKRYARLFSRNELVTRVEQFNIEFDIPETPYVLNPNIDEKEKITKELASFYQEFLKKRVVENPETEPRESCDEAAPKLSEKKIKELESIRRNTTRLFMNIPCLCNQKISENYAKFTETNNEQEFNEYLESFLENLTIIMLNLLGNDVGKFEQYISKWYRTKNIDSVSLLLEAKIQKVASIIRLFLRNNSIPNIKEIFESTSVENANEKLMKSLENWLDKTKMTTSNNGSVENRETHGSNAETARFIHQTFFKYRKQRALQTHQFVENHKVVPEINEIVTEMMETNVENRKIPHVTDMACILSREDKDERITELLKTYFITQYPVLEKFDYDTSTLEISEKLISEHEVEKINEEIQRSFLVKTPEKFSLYEKITERGGDLLDLHVTEELITFVYNKGVIGATGEQLKMNFEGKTYSLDLMNLLEILQENSIFIRAGITKIVFLHHEFSTYWYIKTFQLSEQENNMLEHVKTSTEILKLSDKLERDTTKRKVLLAPWISIDGNLNVELLNEWLTIVFSFCLENPNVTLGNICERFCFVKPVDLFYLFELLQKMKSLKVLVYEKTPVTLTSSRNFIKTRDATILDNFEEMYVEMHSFSMTSLGCYFEKQKKYKHDMNS